MKTPRTYVFMFVAIASQRLMHTMVASGLRVGLSGDCPTDRKYDEKSRLGLSHVYESEIQTPPSDLFWTWFVDDSCPACKSW